MKLTDTQKRTIKYIGFALCGLMGIATLVLLGFVIELAFIPGLFVALGFIVLILLAVLFAVLQHWFIPGMITKVLAVLLGAVMLIGCGYIDKVIKSVDKITDGKIQIENINVYVLKSSTLSNIDETTGHTVGILAMMDIENTRQVIDGLEGIEFEIKEYQTVFDIVNALTDGEIDAMILNAAYLGMVTAVEEYEKFEEGLKTIHTVAIEKIIDHENDDPTLPPLVAITTPVPTTDPMASVTPGENPEATENPEPTADPDNPTPTPYSGLAYDLSLSVPKDKYLHGSKSIFTVYISGIDEYGDVNLIRNSDVNILLTVNLNTGQILMINTPRDYYIQLSGTQQRDKLTHAGVYGVGTSMRTLQMLYGVEIDYYVKINFTGFIKVIDALGGIDVYSEYDFYIENGRHYNKGINHLNGEAALDFARERHAFVNGDVQRGKNQMAVINSLIKKMASSDALLNFNQLFDALSACIVTNMQYDRVSELVRFQLNNMPNWNTVSYSTLGTDAWDLCYSGNFIAYVMYPKEEMVLHARKMIQTVYNNELLVE